MAYNRVKIGCQFNVLLCVLLRRVAHDSQHRADLGFAVIGVRGLAVAADAALLLIRPVLSLEKLSFREEESKFSYRYDPDSSSEETMDYADDQRRVTAWPAMIKVPGVLA